MISSLVYEVDNPYLAYKRNANINRTFIYCNLKAKTRTRGQIRLDNSIG